MISKQLIDCGQVRKWLTLDEPRCANFRPAGLFYIAVMLLLVLTTSPAQAEPASVSRILVELTVVGGDSNPWSTVIRWGDTLVLQYRLANTSNETVSFYSGNFYYPTVPFFYVQSDSAKICLNPPGFSTCDYRQQPSVLPPGSSYSDSFVAAYRLGDSYVWEYPWEVPARPRNYFINKPLPSEQFGSEYQISAVFETGDITVKSDEWSICIAR